MPGAGNIRHPAFGRGATANNTGAIILRWTQPLNFAALVTLAGAVLWMGANRDENLEASGETRGRARIIFY